MAAALRAQAGAIVAANARDMEAARAAGTKESLLDRLMLDAGRIEGMAAALEDLAALPDPLGRVQEERALENGIALQRVSVPLGVVAVVYEARPNVTADAAGICLKSGNAAVLRGGSMAAASNEAIARVLHDAARPPACRGGASALVSPPTARRPTRSWSCTGWWTCSSRAAARGSSATAWSTRRCRSSRRARATATCTCTSADAEKARAIVLNAKCRRYGVCNAAETLLVDRSAATALLPEPLRRLRARAWCCTADERARAAGRDGRACRRRGRSIAADEDDWATEYLAPEMAVKCVAAWTRPSTT